MRRIGLAAGLLLAAALAQAEPLDEQTGQLLVNAVEAAYALDLFNSRCRSDQSGRRTDNLNKELVSRFRMTVLDVQDDLFPEGYYRDAQARMQRDFLARLRAMGGCDGAKQARLRDELTRRYDTAMGEIAARP
ncbi:hypothetical protein F2Q65_08165 [Thiohalocapsa marina]|uniref:TIGR02301 family protein n=1 Tax=Thiohalocapsa marina TaxID=424902 RepID=A0A5M8FPR9_9GAMM|nr:hypothetical protein F2Q65_08165 [Thiohalocapsa marina]